MKKFAHHPFFDNFSNSIESEESRVTAYNLIGKYVSKLKQKSGRKQVENKQKSNRNQTEIK